ncbi:MAG: hypothetical protein HYU03_06585 [Thaumarchaeota archaeon]|nr:hypothetical protein [Nitrososphaerota archaeon]
MLDGKEVDVETAVAEARSLRRWTMILFAVAIAIVFAGLLLVFRADRIRCEFRIDWHSRNI